jgi:hypothetical protein
MSQSPAEETAANLLNRIEEVLLQAEDRMQTAEVDPHRGRLFELFVMADAMGGLSDDSEPDLSAESIARQLADRWNMARELGAGVLQPSRLPPQQLARLRSLWSFMRMWMEWTYAWHRWTEFHPAAPPLPEADE